MWRFATGKWLPSSSWDRPGAISDAVKAIVKATRKPPKFIALDEAKAIATHHRVYEEVEIPQ
ncbi:MAG: hypothetical protein JNK06_04085 [Candidatus Accumulibacter phosphatis]|uniref:hypothetical protein n=1 Tax=Candidatus Accumulibacter phosphatis TaxID=327160 RepID=UPI001A3958D1|nr:hypothetical protein [Candidatus Accumulibacter phosphatis]